MWWWLWERLLQGSGVSGQLQPWGEPGTLSEFLAWLDARALGSLSPQTSQDLWPCCPPRQGCPLTPGIQVGPRSRLLLWRWRIPWGSSHSTLDTPPSATPPSHSATVPVTLGTPASSPAQKGTHCFLPHWSLDGIMGLSYHTLSSLQ